MAYEATFHSGADYKKTDYLAGADIAGGQVVLLGTATGLTCGIAHQPIANGQTGTLAIGGGIYTVVNLNNAALWAKVWWDNATKKATTTSAGNALLGFVVKNGAGGANSNCDVLHFPYV